VVNFTDNAGKPMLVDVNGQSVLGGLSDVPIPANGSEILETDGLGKLQVGSVSVQADGPISGVILFRGFGLAGVGAGQPGRSFRVPIRTAPGFNPGIAFMDLGGVQEVELTLRDESGDVVAAAHEPLGLRHQTARFVNEMNWLPKIDLTRFSGTLTATADDDFTATAILVTPDEFATLPATLLDPPPDAASSHALYFAHFGDGESGGASVSSLIMLFNLESQPATVSLRLRTGTGSPMLVDVNGNDVAGELNGLPIAADGILMLQTDGKGPLQAGSVQVDSNRALAGVILYSGVGVAGVGSSRPAGRFRAPVTAKASLSTALAVMNPGDPQVVRLELRDRSGRPRATAFLNLGAQAQVARFINEIAWEPSVNLTDFVGTVTVNGTTALAGTVLLVSKGELATLPASALDPVAVSAIQPPTPRSTPRAEWDQTLISSALMFALGAFLFVRFRRLSIL